jgi:nucleoid DNA-binding protein
MAAKSVSKKHTANIKEIKKPKLATKAKLPSVTKSYTKKEILSDMASETELSKTQVEGVLLRLQDLIAAHIQKAQPFSLPGLLKIQVVTKSATKARKGVNPFTGKPTVFKAKPACKAVKIKVLKKLKEMI